ncbi:FimV/HubP family polar landmark protein [Marinobacter sp. VGCF2001]|uniref:FimV/HubP family polar landmark protein n=1 Tax=Marinobacter sp. VGCF2001 TaxID=3417189 RepID=UPI003CE9CDE3
MKVRKLAVALALAGGLGSGMAHALGLGEIELQSWLNEPLDAEISLNQSRGVDPGEVFVNVAPESAYERVGLDRHQFLSQLRFEVVTGPDGNLAISVSSRGPVREPYLNFLLELTWPNGRLMREYAVLVDPPVYAEESGIDEQVSAPAVREARQQPARSEESVRRQAAAESSLSRGYGAETFGPTGPSDTLWTIAQQVRPNRSVSMQQVMLAIQDQNPDAFMDGNINRLKRGEVLRVPSLDQIQSRGRAEANRLVAQQNEAFQSPRTVDATDTAQSSPGEASSQPAGDELQLLVADEADTRTAEDGGSAGGDGDLPGGVDAGSAVAMEELEAAKRENEELNTRVQDLQDQVETLQRLIELKNSQLADVQGMVTEDEAGVPEEAADAGAEGSMAPADGEVDADAGGEPAGDAPENGAGDAEIADSAADSAAVTEETEGTADATAATPQDDAAEMAATETEAGDVSEGQSTVAEEMPAEPEQVPATREPEQAPTTQESEAQQPQEPAAAPEKAFPGNIIDGILNNPVYQIALGGGLVVLLLLLLLVARRNANREKEFYEQLNSEEGEGGDSFDLSLEEDAEPQAEGDDAMTEADTYVAYGRHDQAAQVLETAISREPSRTDLRLKLLSVYADNQDRDAFEKQYREVEALEDETAITEAESLRERLAEAEAMPSIDDLESQLRSDSFGNEPESEAADSLAAGDWDISDELKADEFEASSELTDENEFGELASDVSKETDTRDDLIEYDLSGIESGSESGEAEEPASELDYASLELDADLESDKDRGPSDEDDLSLDFESAFEDDALSEDTKASPQSAENAEAAGETPAISDADDDLELDLEFDGDLESTGNETDVSDKTDQADFDLETDALDESFLDELDAELDKVAGEEDQPSELELGESELDDLELDVSDEDLALMEEFSDNGEPAGPQEEEASLDEELELEDALDESASDESGVDLQDPEELAEQAEELDAADVSDDADDELVPVASDSLDADARSTDDALDIDESDLGDEDDFDFLAGTDEAATKLDLARAYIEMGDSDGARDILEEVALEGNEEQKTEAQELLKNLS